ncbi:MAG: NCS2 family permease [Selenomonadaceae bacterium]|nr:NCS2 family permease [Selenomonadaceae bacterium]
MERIRQYFLFNDRRTDFRTEILAGATTFLSMMYIVIVNSTAFYAGGMNFGGVYIATILATVIATLIMGIAANYPIAVAPGLGINAYLVYVVIFSQGIPWQQALGIAAMAAALFTILSLTPLREMFINSIPESLKKAIAAGIGLFITLIGLVSGHIVVDSSATLIAIGSFEDPVLMMTLTGLFVTMVLFVLDIKGSIFIGMVVTAFAAWVLGYWTLPREILSTPIGFDKTFMQLEFDFSPTNLMIVFTILLVTLFDTTGTMLGVGQQAGLIRDGKFPNLKSALLADSIGSLAGAFAGTGPTSAFVESGTGVAAGGRTGFASVVTAILFLALLFLQPIAEAVSSIPAVTAPALILTGCFMVTDFAQIDWKDYTEAFPAFLTMIFMPFTYSITNGVGVGMISYVILKFVTGQWRDIHPMLAIMAVLFTLQLLY